MLGFSGVDGGSCVRCEAGKYLHISGLTTCWKCDSGKYSASSAATTCQPCAPHSHSGHGSSFCRCDEGFQKEADGSCALIGNVSIVITVELAIARSQWSKHEESLLVTAIANASGTKKSDVSIMSAKFIDSNRRVAGQSDGSRLVVDLLLRDANSMTVKRLEDINHLNKFLKEAGLPSAISLHVAKAQKEAGAEAGAGASARSDDEEDEEEDEDDNSGGVEDSPIKSSPDEEDRHSNDLIMVVLVVVGVLCALGVFVSLYLRKDFARKDCEDSAETELAV